MATKNERPENETEIDGFKVTTTHMDPLKLYPLAPRVLKILAPVLGKLNGLILDRVKKLKGVPSEKLIERAIGELLVDPRGLDQVAPILLHLAEELGRPENAKMPLELLADTTIDIPDDDGEPERYTLTTPKEISEAFRGRFFLMLKCMWFAMGVNFGDFFSGAPAADRIKG